MMNLLKYLDDRLGEPSTWTSIAVVLGMLHVSVDPGLVQTLSAWGVVASAVLGGILAEGGSKPVGQVVSDALASLVVAIKAMPSEPPKQ